jgi:hypothetical protein
METEASSPSSPGASKPTNLPHQTQCRGRCIVDDTRKLLQKYHHNEVHPVRINSLSAEHALDQLFRSETRLQRELFSDRNNGSKRKVTSDLPAQSLTSTIPP